METRANFALIGALTLVVAFAAFGFVYWFAGPSQTAKYVTYKIVFPGSVSGLSRGASVLFNGLKVGEVTHLAISEDDPSRVDVLINIDRKTPVKTNTAARLETKGFTGVAEVLLVGGTPGAPELKAERDKPYPQIEADRSEMQDLMVNVKRLSTQASGVLTKLDKLLDENSSTLTATLTNAKAFTKTLADNSGNISAFIRDASDLAHSLKPAVARLDKVLAAGEQTIKALDPKKLKTITSEIAGASVNLNRFSATGLRQYEQLAVDARKAVDTLDRAVRTLEKDPSQVIFGPSQTVPEYQGQGR
jgi:phospholipid/cholesterol/gamma-HCH transport system substrate-binding protein